MDSIILGHLSEWLHFHPHHRQNQSHQCIGTIPVQRTFRLCYKAPSGKKKFTPKWYQITSKCKYNSPYVRSVPDVESFIYISYIFNSYEKSWWSDGIPQTDVQQYGAVCYTFSSQRFITVACLFLIRRTDRLSPWQKDQMIQRKMLRVPFR